jgi:hypothetical protein
MNEDVEMIKIEARLLDDQYYEVEMLKAEEEGHGCCYYYYYYYYYY